MHLPKGKRRRCIMGSRTINNNIDLLMHDRKRFDRQEAGLAGNMTDQEDFYAGKKFLFNGSSSAGGSL